MSGMRFCPTCGNMLYIRTEGGGVEEQRRESLVYYCKNCLHTAVEPDDRLSMPVFDNVHTLGQDEARFEHFMTPDIEHDPTLPRSRHMPCPNGCQGSEVIYIKYDPANLKYLYFCSQCKGFWRLQQQP